MKCIIIDDDLLVCKILEELIQKTQGLQLIHIFHNPIEALNTIQNYNEIDIVFLDMEMPEMSGLQFLQSLLYTPHIIFISSNRNYAVDAFNLNAIDFLLKPIEYSRFLKSIQKVKEKLKEDSSQINSETDNSFFFKKKNTYYKVLRQDILWLEAHDNYTKVITFDNSFLTNNTLKSFEDKLPNSIFKRVHRSYIINKTYLSKIEENKLVIEYKDKSSSIPFSKMYKDSILNSNTSFK